MNSKTGQRDMAPGWNLHKEKYGLIPGSKYHKRSSLYLEVTPSDSRCHLKESMDPVILSTLPYKGIPAVSSLQLLPMYSHIWRRNRGNRGKGRQGRNRGNRGKG